MEAQLRSTLSAIRIHALDSGAGVTDAPLCASGGLPAVVDVWPEARGGLQHGSDSAGPGPAAQAGPALHQGVAQQVEKGTHPRYLP